MDDDPELAAIRAKLRAELMQGGQSAASASAPILEDIGDVEFEGFVTRHDTVVVDCWAPWCGPCRIVGPIVEELSREMAGRVAFAKLNVDLNPRVAQAFGIMSIPTLLVFRQGRLVDRIVGAHPKQQLAGLIERHLGRRSTGAPGPRRL